MARRDIKSSADYDRALRSMQKRLDGLTKNIKSTTVKAVTDIAFECLGDAVERAPVENGTLRGSGYVNVNQSAVAKGRDGIEGGIDIIGTLGEPTGDEIVAEIGFSEKYAFIQHEHVEFNHPIGGQAKFLESVIVENEDKWKKRLIDAAKEGIDNSDA